MRHLTLNTGHVRESARREVSPAALAALAPLLVTGEHALPVPAGYRLYVTTDQRALVATFYRGGAEVPLATILVAPDEPTATRLWPVAELHYRTMLQLLRMPDRELPQVRLAAPWCAVVVVLPAPGECAWLGDAERCLAWAWLDRVASADN